MDIVIETSAIIAVLAGESEKEQIIRVTRGNDLIGPGSIRWEVGNAFSSMFKQDRLELDQAIEGLLIFETIPIRYIDPDMTKVLTISKQTNSDAYDAYFLDCAIRHKAPLLTLDNKLTTFARDLNIEIIEILES